jgi:hypothetical protein
MLFGITKYNKSRGTLALLALIAIILALISTDAFAECKWSEKKPIRNNNVLSFQVCDESKTVKINGVEVTPNIPFELVFPDCPECNLIWSRISPDGNTAVVWIVNDESQRNAWVINLTSGAVELFTDKSEGKHYLVKFKSDSEFIITHAGMGYRTDYYYSRIEGTWSNTGREEVDVKW